MSEVINDSGWQYRANCEFSVGFTGWSAEYHGILSEDSIIFGDDGIPSGVNSGNWQQTASGGGSQDLADESTGAFDEIVPEIEGGIN